ncbi:hypothetical protein K491DRAFT_475875 [Lophiostoma macrostomum CBS 122681]|uniref:DUF300-domain-containing protein n=1 Tax=Lophiostoma macrostomum CBS 122681 TaxID=1314788 RepID=A0A6A6T648_9PLEO|nr:hypothetical protein K491DRAFT_475875 [Lophiostoma macrostomum CBS 122681]
MSAVLVSRGIFSDDDSKSTKAVCPSEPSGTAIEPLVGNMTFQRVAEIVSGACGIFSMLVILAIIFKHARHYSNPIQQRQIIRIVLLIPWVSFFCWLIIFQEGAGLYLLESLDFGCAIALSAFLLLLCDYILQQEGGFDDLFGEGAWKRGQFSKNSPPWLKRTWYSVLQFIPISLLLWLVTVITVAASVYCAQSNSIHFAHIWVQVIKVIFTTIAVLSILRFYKMMKAKLHVHNVFLKLFAFKGIIGLNALQTFIISILVGHDVIKPSSSMSYDDLTTALPQLVLACEMPIFAVLLFFAFPTTPYQNAPIAQGTNFFIAVGQALNITDLISCFIRGPMRLLREQSRGMVRQDSIPLVQSSGNEYAAPGYHGAQGYAGPMA